MKTRILPLLGLLFLGFVPNDDKDSSGFTQDRFVISFWYDPPADENMDIRYKEISDAHFNVAMGGFGAKTESNVRKQLELCKKYGMKSIISLPGFVKGATEGRIANVDVIQQESFSDHDACWGYMLRDEPSAKDFPNLSYMVNHIKTSHPGKLAFINIFPNYASPEQLGTESYEEHVNRFVKEVNPQVLCMDHYPYMEPDVSALNLDHTSDWVLDKENPLIEKISRTGYCENLEVLRKVCLKKDIPFWNFFNVMPFGYHSDPTEAQLRWQVYTSIAYGAKGILYFCYQSPSGAHGSIFEKGGAILTVDGRNTRHYEEAKRINFAVKNLGSTLMNLKSVGVYRVSKNEDSKDMLKGAFIKELTEGDYLIGEFIHSDGRRAVLINNYSYAYTAWPTVVFDANPDEIIEIDQNSGLETAIIDDSPDMEGLQISLNSGAGRLFLLPKR